MQALHMQPIARCGNCDASTNGILNF